MVGKRKGTFVMVPEHQLGYLKVICGAASRAAARAQESAAAARLKLVDSADGDGVQPAQLQSVWRLQRDAIQKMNIVLFFGQLYVAAFRSLPPRGPSLAYDEPSR